MKSKLPVFLIVIILIFCRCGTKIDVAAEKEVLLEESRAFNDALVARDTEKLMLFFAGDFTYVGTTSGISTDLEGIQNDFEEFFKVPENTTNWTSIQIYVSIGGDIAFETASSKQKIRRKEGVVDVTYYFLAIWKKQEDGSWKISVWK